MRTVAAAYVILGVLLWPLPLLGLLHAESSAVVAAAAFFVAGLSAISQFRRGVALSASILWHLAALVVPLTMLTLSLLWRPNCGYVDGLVFYLLFAMPSIPLAVGLAYALDRWNVRWPAGWLVGIGAAVCVAGPVYDIGFHPQFYTYNHVFGGVLGPVYDEELALRSGLFVFRGMTLVWAALLMLIGAISRRNGGKERSREMTANRKAMWGAGAAAGALLAGYMFSAEIGINTTQETLKEALPGVIETKHFDIYYRPGRLSESDLRAVADQHEFRYHRLARALGVEVDGRIQSFLYPDAEVKAELTGARYTNVAPVWLSTPQVHVLVEEFERVFPHELVHVFSREFGLPILNASLSVGLVEGLAVALEAADGRPTPHEQVSAALLSTAPAKGGGAPDARGELARSVSTRMSPAGFWGGRGAISYTTMGSFVRYLIDAYGAEPLKAVYPLGNFSEVYGKSAERLAEEWTASVLGLSAVDASAGPLAAARFAVPSLFEKRCPHYVPPHRLAYRRASTALTRGDSTAALEHAAVALEHEPRYTPALDLWSRLSLIRGLESGVRRRLEPLASDSLAPVLFVRLGDARGLTGDSVAARAAYSRAKERLPSFAHDDASLIYLRSMVAGRPAVLRALLTGSAPPTSSGALGAVIHAFHLARLERYDSAAEHLGAAPALHAAGVDDEASIYVEESLRRRRLVWMARFSYRAGALSVASTYAERAAEAYRIAGAFNEAAQLDDFQQMMVWLASSSTVPTSPNAGIPAARQ